MNTIIKLRCIDQVLTLEDTPLIASGGVQEDFISVEFCSKWAGLTKTAVFWRSEDEPYHVLLDKNDTCVIPPEVLTEEGRFYFGLFGVSSDGKQRTSEVMRYTVSKGAITSGTKPSDPTPDIYTQILAKYQDVLEKKLTAADVGARPDTWMPTAADVGAVKHEYYGGDMNDLVTDGHYRLGANANLPGYAYYGQCIASRGNDMDTVVQLVFGISTQGKVHYAIFRSGKFTSGAWVFEAWAQFATTDYAVNKAGDTMTGNLDIERTQYPAVVLKDLTQNRRAELMYNENEEVILNNAKDYDNRTLLFLRNEGHVDGLVQISKVVDGTWVDYRVLHEGNKPSGNYTGTGGAWNEPLQIGGIGMFLMVTLNGARFALIGASGGVILNTSGRVTEYLSDAEVYFRDGKLVMVTANEGLNHAAWYYDYQVL